MPESRSRLEVVGSTVQVLSVVVGVVISVLSFNSTRQKEAEARKLEAEKPFQELRRTVYLETVKNAAIIANPENRKPDEIAKAKRRFRELYVAELSMVETDDVAKQMVNLAEAVDPQLRQDMTAQQVAALALAHALRDSYTTAGRAVK